MYTTTKITVRNGAINAIDGARSTADLAYIWSTYVKGEWPNKINDCHRTILQLFGVKSEKSYDLITSDEDNPCSVANYNTPATKEYVEAVGLTMNKMYEDFINTLHVPAVLGNGVYEVGYQLTVERIQ